MNSQDIPSGRSSKRQLQGPRPSPLRVNKESHKIKKPPVVPLPCQLPAPPRQPVIIYTVSPKVIHTTPSEFMSLVQRLTGSSSSSSSSNKVLIDPLNDNKDHGGDNNDLSGNLVPSTTAWYAGIEMVRPSQSIKEQPSESRVDVDVGGSDIVSDGVLERPSMFRGILSPGPALLSPIPSNFVSPPSTDPNMVSFFQDLSPVLHSNRNFMEGTFIMSSPSNFVSPRTPSIDLFNNFSYN
ncbi:hypothetical protein PHAVU_008G159700 [Phaseolus vulgaris]|uniref:VQ domain-containing protein n=1 Tax=Phaseolus vulgaris TaxID=3885 RepID=V7B5A9_PHAVU|nr:hypothetical protein PHAVU_008G159700g [Phaseolus vulgaris]ESW13004.1 hypothetical protein PHAVU_008G159700g [Phaseolus vulgaris]